MLSASDISFTSNFTGTSGTYTQIASYTYTPISASSYIIVEVNGVYSVSGANGDDWYSQITVAGNEVGYNHQIWTNGTGGGTRSGVLFPLMGRYTNGSSSAKIIAINVKKGTSDDTLTVYSDVGFWLKVTEIAQ
jgi:hypothetical protein